MRDYRQTFTRTKRREGTKGRESKFPKVFTLVAVNPVCNRRTMKHQKCSISLCLFAGVSTSEIQTSEALNFNITDVKKKQTKWKWGKARMDFIDLFPTGRNNLRTCVVVFDKYYMCIYVYVCVLYVYVWFNMHVYLHRLCIPRFNKILLRLVEITIAFEPMKI